jgi:hypothetical protein
MEEIETAFSSSKLTGGVAYFISCCMPADALTAYRYNVGPSEFSDQLKFSSMWKNQIVAHPK